MASPNTDPLPNICKMEVTTEGCEFGYRSSAISSSLQKEGKKTLTENRHSPFLNGNAVKRQPRSKESFEKVSMYVKVFAYLGLNLLMFLGYLNQILFVPRAAKEKNREGYGKLYDPLAQINSLYMYRRLRDCWNHPISSVPGAFITLKDRITKDSGWTFEYTGTESKCLNLGSYNYLGFAESSGPCAEQSAEAIKEFGCGICSPRQELGTLQIHQELERTTARFVGTEDALTFGMGFATNSMNLPAFVSKGCLVLSDEKNHASLILGLRLSGATTRVFKHNNVSSLRKMLEQAVSEGQPKTKEPWKKILIVVEGVYSMEGSIVHLPEIIELKKQFKAYLYLDEAHSVGAMGKHGRGVVDYYGCDPKDVDILMGTFTKSFGSAGGYIAGSKKLINHLRVNSHAACYATSMSPACAQQIISSMRIIMGEDGTNEGKFRLLSLARNTRYFRRSLERMGVITYGSEDSPVVPMLGYMHSKIGVIVRTMKERNIAVVGVVYPATPFLEGRIRFCLSAAHTKEMLDKALKVIEEMADLVGLRYSKKPQGSGPGRIAYADSESEDGS